MALTCQSCSHDNSKHCHYYQLLQGQMECLIKRILSKQIGGIIRTNPIPLDCILNTSLRCHQHCGPCKKTIKLCRNCFTWNLQYIIDITGSLQLHRSFLCETSYSTTGWQNTLPNCHVCLQRQCGVRTIYCDMSITTIWEPQLIFVVAEFPGVMFSMTTPRIPMTSMVSKVDRLKMFTKEIPLI